MRRLPTTLFLLCLSSSLVACGGSKPAQSASDVDDDGNPKAAAETAAADDNEAGTPPPTSDKPAPGSADDSAAGGPKKDECNVFDEANLEAVLLKSSCEVPSPTGAPPDLTKKLEVKVTVVPSKVRPGAHADVLVSFINHTNANLPLYFTIDPMPRFEIEVYDKKSNRVDLPKNQPPPLPAGMAARVPGDPRTARIVLAPNGTARMPLGWDAVKTKWAPEKLKGTPPEKGYPRAPAGSLPKGKYSLKVATPLTFVFEGVDHEVSQPLVPVELGK